MSNLIDDMITDNALERGTRRGAETCPTWQSYGLSSVIGESTLSGASGGKMQIASCSDHSALPTYAYHP